MALMNVQTHQVQVLHAFNPPYVTTLYATATDGRYFAWVETRNNDSLDFSDWTIYAYDMQTGQVKLIAQAPQANGHPLPAHGPIITLDHHLLVWTQAVLAPNSPTSGQIVEKSDVEAYDFDTQQMTILAHGAAYARLSWPWIMWGVLNANALLFTNLQTHQTVQLQQTPDDLALAGGSLAYGQPGGQSITLVSDITHPDVTSQTVVTVNTGNSYYYVEFPSLNDRLVTWLGANGPHEVWDRVQRRIVTLLPDFASWPEFMNGVFINGPYLLWITPGPGGKTDPQAHILDTRLLPATSPGA